MEMLSLYNGAQLKNNIVNQASENNPDYTRLESRKASRTFANKIKGDRKINQALTILKQENKTFPKALEIVNDNEEPNDQEPSDLEGIPQPKAKNLAAFMENDSEQEVEIDKENQSPRKSLPENEKTSPPKPNKLLADFCSDEEQQRDLPQISVINLDSPKNREQPQQQNNVKAEQAESIEKQVVAQLGSKFFVMDERTFALSPIAANTTVKVSMLSKPSSLGQTYNLFLGDHEIMTCINKKHDFIFENSGGMLAHMEYTRGLYEIFCYHDDTSFLGACGLATIQIERKSIKERRFSSIKVYESLRKNSSRTAKSEYEKDPTSARIFRSRDPFINGDGRLELKISLSGCVRPSPFNCLIEDEKGNEVCSLLEGLTLQACISDSFTVLLGMCCAVARLDWSSQFKK